MHDKILLIEDDASIIRFLSLSLDKNGYKVIEARNGIEGISLFMSDNPDLILLDLGLPDIDGSEVLRQIRSQSEVPILVVSARGQEREKVEALDLGADDYVTKPFHINELLARVRVALRKKTPRVVKEKVFVLDGLRVDFEKYKVYVEDREVHLTPIEFKLLVLLIEHAGKVLTHSFITVSYTHLGLYRGSADADWRHCTAAAAHVIMVPKGGVRGEVLHTARYRKHSAWLSAIL